MAWVAQQAAAGGGFESPNPVCLDRVEKFLVLHLRILHWVDHEDLSAQTCQILS